MFATLTGTWPRLLGDGRSIAALEADVAAGRLDRASLEAARDGLVREALRAQLDAGLEPLTDGQVRWADMGLAVAHALTMTGTGTSVTTPRPAVRQRGEGVLVTAWRSAVAIAADVRAELAGDGSDGADVPDVLVKQAVPGPYTLARRLQGDAPARHDLTLALADALASELADLAAAGCRVVEVEEPGAVDIGDADAERELFVEAHRRLLAPVPDLHATLAITGGSAEAAGGPTVLAPAYRSYLFDLVAGPDNWRLVAVAPGDRGIVCGALEAAAHGEDPSPLLVWAARYAASTNGRGMARVGLSNASGLGGLSREAAAAGTRVLGKAARLAALPPEAAVRAGLDPRSFDSRTAAYRRVSPRPASRRRQGGGAAGPNGHPT